MTDEELKEEFKKYLKDSSDYYDPREPITERKILQIWLDCAEPREKKITKLECQVDKLKEENERLRQQIEKMKCCTNCKHNECKCEDVVCKKENECWYDKKYEELSLELEEVKLECWELAE